MSTQGYRGRHRADPDTGEWPTIPPPDEPADTEEE